MNGNGDRPSPDDAAAAWRIPASSQARGRVGPRFAPDDWLPTGQADSRGQSPLIRTAPGRNGGLAARSGGLTSPVSGELPEEPPQPTSSRLGPSPAAPNGRVMGADGIKARAIGTRERASMARLMTRLVDAEARVGLAASRAHRSASRIDGIGTVPGS